MSVYPNPASSEFYVSIGTSQKPISTILLSDLTGRLAKEVSNVNSYTTSIRVDDMNTGVYLLSLKLRDGTTATRRVVVE